MLRCEKYAHVETNTFLRRPENYFFMNDSGGAAFFHSHTTKCWFCVHQSYDRDYNKLSSNVSYGPVGKWWVFCCCSEVCARTRTDHIKLESIFDRCRERTHLFGRELVSLQWIVLWNGSNFLFVWKVENEKKKILSWRIVWKEKVNNQFEEAQLVPFGLRGDKMVSLKIGFLLIVVFCCSGKNGNGLHKIRTDENVKLIVFITFVNLIRIRFWAIWE